MTDKQLTEIDSKMAQLRMQSMKISEIKDVINNQTSSCNMISIKLRNGRGEVFSFDVPSNFQYSLSMFIKDTILKYEQNKYEDEKRLFSLYLKAELL